ncbi:hypothetical protein RRG08_032118 [Elysia crispata]|uniref:Reverse transcriptase domain-containing protein n=1 Tax=Elysia crispata TaxID=231223 RepID=A0AAE1DFE6_9GAST|nr:hypothetical protein RRG08_032118 [Elysia crispata]
MSCAIGQFLVTPIGSSHGIPALTRCGWFENRTQTVSIDNNKATPSPLKYGVPQGSVLGPLLFTMYTAPVADIAERHGVNYHLYADDTQLYVPLDNTLETASYQKESIEKCVVEIADWMNSNKLKEYKIRQPGLYPVLKSISTLHLS